MRARVAVLAAVLIALSICLPIVAAFQLAWHLAVSTQQDRLTLFNDHAIRRASLTFSTAKDTLKSMASTGFTPCSDEHIAKMQLVNANNQYIAGIGYIDREGFLRCTALGRTTITIKHSPSPHVLDDGVSVIRRMMPRVTGSEPRIVLYRDNYDVLIDPKQLVDISLDEGTQLAVTLEKVGVLAERGNPNARFVQSLISDPRAGTNRDYVYAAARRGEWTAIAIQNIDQIDPEYTRLKEALIPIGALISLLFIGASIWIIRWCNSLKADLILAVWRKEFTIHYQPLIDIRNGACVGAEALIRWRRRDGSFVSPDTFIPLAEQSSLIFSITDQVIASVVREMAPTLSAERSLHISINLSASDVSTGRVLDVLERELSGTGIRSEQIWLEATERGFVKIDDARDVILRAHQHGYSIVMDDFGTGYSSLQYLESLPLDALKIDKSFVNTIGKAMAKSSVTPHIIEMARTLNLACIAEGVETDQQLKYLAEQGVQFAQGWLFSKPLPAAEFLAFFARRKAEFGSGPEATDSGSGDLTLIASPPTSQAAS